MMNPLAKFGLLLLLEMFWAHDTLIADDGYDLM